MERVDVRKEVTERVVGEKGTGRGGGAEAGLRLVGCRLVLG